MQYRLLGKTGVWVSSLCMGTMTFGNESDETESAKMYQMCRDAGINFFDCANAYSAGRAEEILGKLVAGHRDEIVLTTKGYNAMTPDRNSKGASRRNLIRSVDDSLRRLNTDRIDVYFIHLFDPDTDLEQTLRVLDDLVQAGKILYPAVSNFSAWQTEKALAISDRHGWAPIECIQPMYNLVKRQAEVEILPMAQAEKLAVISYSPLGGGLLTGKYGPDRRPESGRLVEVDYYQARYKADWLYDTAGQLTEFARNRSLEPASLAVAWVMSHPAITAAIIGARSTAQLQPSLNAVNIPMTPEFRAEISALSPEPPPATDRSEAQQRV